MSENQVVVLSTSTIQVESTVQINLTPSDLELLFLEYSQKDLLFPKPSPEQAAAVLARSGAVSIIHHLEASLRRTLRFFPPLAGRLATAKSDDGSATCFFVDCGGGGGALFVHAAARDASITVADILGASASCVPEIVRSFFPLTGVRNCDALSRPLLAVQVTELSDGLFVECSINHLLVDGTSFWHFFNSWAEISRGEIGISKPPSLDPARISCSVPYSIYCSFTLNSATC